MHAVCANFATEMGLKMEIFWTQPKHSILNTTCSYTIGLYTLVLL